MLNNLCGKKYKYILTYFSPPRSRQVIKLPTMAAAGKRVSFQISQPMLNAFSSPLQQPLTDMGTHDQAKK